MISCCCLALFLVRATLFGLISLFLLCKSVYPMCGLIRRSEMPLEKQSSMDCAWWKLLAPIGGKRKPEENKTCHLFQLLPLSGSLKTFRGTRLLSFRPKAQLEKGKFSLRLRHRKLWICRVPTSLPSVFYPKIIRFLESLTPKFSSQLHCSSVFYQNLLDGTRKQ